MSNIKSPIIICGHPGGGTSYITKILRYSGMFAGVDEEIYLKVFQWPYFPKREMLLGWVQTVKTPPQKGGVNHNIISSIEDRKTHEHKLFNDLINYIYVKCIESTPLMSQQSSYNLQSHPNWHHTGSNQDEIFANIQIDELYRLTQDQPDQFKDKINQLKKDFDYIKDDFFNLFFDNKPKDQIWGWKYPLNSAVIPILKILFDNPKFLFISKEHKLNNIPQSKGGKMFQNSSKTNRELFTNPPWLDESYNHKTINFEEVLTDWTKMKDMLQWLSLGATTSTGDPKDFNENDFKKLLRITKFEPKKI